MAKALKVLIISEMSLPYASGGGEVRYGLLARGLAQRGHDVTWLSMKQRQSPTQERREGVMHLHRGPRITAPPVRSLWAKLQFMWAVVMHLLRHRYDVVDCQTYAPLPAAWLACRLHGMSLIATIHDTAAPAPAGGEKGDQWMSPVDRWLAKHVERRLYRLSYQHVLTVSEAVRADLVQRMGLSVQQITVVHNAIDLEHIAGVARSEASGQVDLIFVGRLIPHKHPEVVLQVMAQITAHRHAIGRPAPTALIVGGGPLAASLTRTAQELGLAQSCRLVGEVGSHDEVIAHLKSARVLLLPSTREGFGLVLAEAMACGVATVAWRLPPLQETLGEGLQHCLVSPGDVQELVRAIERLLDDQGLWQQTVVRGHQRVQTAFDGTSFVPRVLQVYQKAFAAQRRGQKKA